MALRQRVVTAVMLVPLVVLVVFWLPAPWFAAAIALAVLAAAWEWAALAGLSGRPARAGYLAITVLLLEAGGRLAETGPGLAWLIGVGAAWWLVAAAFVVARASGLAARRWPLPFGMLAGWLVLVPAWIALVMLHRVSGQGPWLVMLLFLVIWIADISAFFTGRRWGRHRLAAQVSPGKTWEGLAGALAAVVAAGALFAWMRGFGPGDVALFAGLLGALVVVSVIGDLFESMFKRDAGIKDSGSLLPGHGGVLDRIDSLTAAAPVFGLAYLLLDKGA